MLDRSLSHHKSVKIPIKKKLSAASISKRRKSATEHIRHHTGASPSSAIFAPSSIFSGSLRRKRSLSLDEGTLALELDKELQAARVAHLNPSIRINSTPSEEQSRVRAKTFTTTTAENHISWAQDTLVSKKRNIAFQPAYRMSNGV